MAQTLERYDITRDYRWNYDHVPEPVSIEIPTMSGSWTFLGRPISSPLGMPAGPLLNGRWVRYYASLGFDVLTYKTVRSSARECYPIPNLVPVRTDALQGGETELSAEPKMSGSWAVSFGMPSAQPDDWRKDIEQTRGDLREDQLLVVSVVGTIQPDWSIDELADDYALCARWAVESGADAIETNFSCPNVCSRDGQLYQEPKPAGIVASRVRAAIGTTPYLAKIGHLDNPTDAILLLDTVSEFVDGLAMTNSVATSVREPKGGLMFAGQKRGICGAATRKASIAQTKMFSELIKTKDLGIKLIGVGGVGTSEHVRAYLEAGAEAVHIATAAMVDPLVACSIRKSF